MSPTLTLRKEERRSRTRGQAPKLTDKRGERRKGRRRRGGGQR